MTARCADLPFAAPSKSALTAESEIDWSCSTTVIHGNAEILPLMIKSFISKKYPVVWATGYLQQKT